MFTMSAFDLTTSEEEEEEEENPCEWINEKAIVDKLNGMALYETNKFGK